MHQSSQCASQGGVLEAYDLEKARKILFFTGLSSEFILLYKKVHNFLSILIFYYY